MENKEEMWQALIDTVKHQVLPATGCTEPISLGFACATAVKYLDNKEIDQIEAKVLPNLMKNGMGVTVPNTGMVGLPIVAAIGAFGGDAAAGLDVLQKTEPRDIEIAKIFLQQKRVTVVIAQTDKALYSEANIYTADEHVRVCIEDYHTNIILIEKNGEMILKKDHLDSSHNHVLKVMEYTSVKLICEFAK